MATKKQSRSDQNQRGRYLAGGTAESYPDRLGWWERKVFPRAATDVQVTITPRYAGRPDLLAFDLYGTSSLIWMVLQYNSIIDINTEFIVGSVITLPTKNRLYTQLLSNS
jgi:hypothetical protein